MRRKVRIQFSLDAYVGKRFGERVIIGPARLGERGNEVLCRCDAGHESWVRVGHLNSGDGGRCKTCHCTKLGNAHKHWAADTPAYQAWMNMRHRVNHDESYVRRGIQHCERWNDFEAFLQDMGQPTPPAIELDRINGHEGYEPSNCRWATHAQNNANRTNLRMITFDGKTLCVAHWEKLLGVKLETFRKKLRSNRPLAIIMAELGYRPS